jgi:transketolase
MPTTDRRATLSADRSAGLPGPQPIESSFDDLDRLSVTTVRLLAADAVQEARSGHPGLPMGAAEIAYVLWTRFLKHNPANPAWPDRDRFVLSAGHGSMLLYALLYLTGYDLPLDEIRRFRQWGSRTPGHPEFGLTPGVETTTGPLGQGFASAVGMAIAEAHLAARFNRPALGVVDHRTYVLASDGDLMEGVSHEAASLAGHLGLGRFICLYDANGISIDGPTSLTFTEDVAGRFLAYGWHVQTVDGHDMRAVQTALLSAVNEAARPSLIVARTHIGYGSPNRQDTAKAHGEPLGEEELRVTKERIDWPGHLKFHVPSEVLSRLRQALARGAAAEGRWVEQMETYQREHPDLAADLRRALAGELPPGWSGALPTFPTDRPLATRAASGRVLDALAERIPSLVGGSADLTSSNNTQARGQEPIQRGALGGRYLHFGVREHGMGAVLNGLSLHGGVRPYGGTFLVFSDYMRPAIRLAALMHQPVIFVFTHDSIGLGEDGPTHQPIEHLASLRAMPNLVVLRPADATETAEAWRVALEQRESPTALVLTRQSLPVLDRAVLAPAAGVARGGYILWDAKGAEGDPEVLLIGTGSEVHLALDAGRRLAHQGITARVISLPSTDLFERQAEEYRESVLPSRITARVGVEAAAPFGWDRYVGPVGEVVSLRHFGASAPYETIYARLGITGEAVAAAALRSMARARSRGRADDGDPKGGRGWS